MVTAKVFKVGKKAAETVECINVTAARDYVYSATVWSDVRFAEVWQDGVRVLRIGHGGETPQPSQSEGE
jgi:hypothetical protein